MPDKYPPPDNPSTSPTGRPPGRTAAPKVPTLAEPVTVAQFWKNRRGEVIRVSLSTYEGRDLVDVRQCFTNSAGQLQATKKGVAMSVLRLPELRDAICKAVAKAIELGLIEGEAP